VKEDPHAGNSYLAVVIVGGVMLADLVANSSGTSALFSGVGSLWQMSLTACSQVVYWIGSGRLRRNGGGGN